MDRKFFIDAAERVVATFLEVFIGGLAFTGVANADISTAKVAAVAGVSSALATLKAIVASSIGNKNSAAALPASTGV